MAVHRIGAFALCATAMVVVAGCSASPPAPSASPSLPTSPSASIGPEPTPTFTGPDAAFCASIAAAVQAQRKVAAAEVNRNLGALGTAMRDMSTAFADALAALPDDAPAQVRTELREAMKPSASPGATPSPGTQLLAYVAKTCATGSN